jgi:hypothetical protein
MLINPSRGFVAHCTPSNKRLMQQKNAVTISVILLPEFATRAGW